jgi:Ricin-type beta-trefoil lectin domain
LTAGSRDGSFVGERVQDVSNRRTPPRRISGRGSGRKARAFAVVATVVAGAVTAAIAVPATAQTETVRIVTPGGHCIDVEQASTENRARVLVWECNGQANQSWLMTSRKIDEFGQSWFEIRSVHSDRCLDVAGASTALEAKLIQYQCRGGDNQLFSLSEDTPQGRVIRPRHSGLCLDIYRALDEPGTQLQQYTCDGGPNQRFFVRGDAQTPAPPGTTPPDATPTPQPGPAVGETRVLFYRVANVWEVRRRATLVRRLSLRGLPRGTVVTVRCRGGGCPYSRRGRRARTKRMNLQRAFRGRRLAHGTVVRLVLEMPGFGTYTVRFRTRAGALPRRTDYCPSRRSTKLRRCG